MLYKGSCHCGKIAFEVEGDLNGVEMTSINARCLENVDLSALPVKQFDGRSM